MAAGSTYTPITTQTYTSASQYLVLTSITGIYTDLLLVGLAKSANTNNPSIVMTLNSATTNYGGAQLYGNSTTTGSNKNTVQPYICLGRSVGTSPSTGNTTAMFINFMNYSSSTAYKTVIARICTESGTELDSGRWADTSPITRIDFDMGSSNLAVGTMFTLYGIKAA